MIRPIGCVFLAGGASARFGTNKLLAPIDGMPLIETVLRRFPKDGFARAVVVARHEETASIARALGYEALVCPRETEVFSGTIRAGLSALRTDDISGCLFSVCDQPRLCPESVLRLADEFLLDTSRICALGYQRQRGNPAIFPRDMFCELLALAGDASGRDVMRAHPERVHIVPIESAQELEDIDTVADWERLR